MSGPAAQIRTTTTESLLGLLSVKPQSGYELKKFIERSIGNFWNESFGQIYPTLKRMAAEGLAEVSEGEGSGGRERKVYSLTAAGRERLRDWLQMPATDQVPRNELLLKLFFGDFGDRERMCAHVVEKKAQLMADLRKYEAIEAATAAAYPEHPALPYWLMTLRYGKAEAKGLLLWCDESLQTFKEMR
jgi:PadR family transcriptional regulator AphA